mmetsp:Transcript_41473/g.63283  ORF Transcript_41473/g.63283 Transcript_41473/m.63283 type:complete len:215 (+) Transcript_41473:188-832(+)
MGKLMQSESHNFQLRERSADKLSSEEGAQKKKSIKKFMRQKQKQISKKQIQDKLSQISKVVKVHQNLSKLDTFVKSQMKSTSSLEKKRDKSTGRPKSKAHEFSPEMRMFPNKKPINIELGGTTVLKASSKLQRTVSKYRSKSNVIKKPTSHSKERERSKPKRAKRSPSPPMKENVNLGNVKKLTAGLGCKLKKNQSLKKELLTLIQAQKKKPLK